MLTSRRSDAPFLSQAARLARRKAIAYAIRDGATMAQAMDAFGVSRTTVNAACREFKVTRPRVKVVRSGRPRRPVRFIGGVPHYLCHDCERAGAGEAAWKPVSAFYRHSKPQSRCGILSVCKMCSCRRVTESRRALAKARKVEREGAKPSPTCSERSAEVA